MLIVIDISNNTDNDYNKGDCQKCREKVQWRFKYDKYKPLKHPATCMMILLIKLNNSNNNY